MMTINKYFVVRETSRREDGDLLTTSNWVHGIKSRQTGLNHLFGIYAREGIDRLTGDVEEIFGENGRARERLTRAVENTTKHMYKANQATFREKKKKKKKNIVKWWWGVCDIFRDGGLQDLACELAVSVLGINTSGSLKDLQNGKQWKNRSRQAQTWTTAFLPATSSTWPRRFEPSPRVMFTISA